MLLVLLLASPACEPQETGGRTAAPRPETTGQPTNPEATTERPVVGETDVGGTTAENTTAEGTAVEETAAPEEPAEGVAGVTGALVPVAHLTSPLEGLTVQELGRVEDLAVPRGLRETAEASLGRRGFRGFGSAEAVVEHVSRTPGAVGLVPWDAVEPRVKALAVDGEHPLEDGDGAGADPEGYPLGTAGADRLPDPDRLRRVVVGGDVLLDRGIYYSAFIEDRGVDYPISGGHAAVTGRTPEPSPFSEFGVIHQFTAERRGRAGAVRRYLGGADLALANLENPVLADSVYHADGVTFTGDLRLLPALGRAGIDGVTLANNHTMDAGAEGLLETMRHLDAAGLAHAGGGEDLAAAREPMTFDLDGLTVGVLSYLGVPGYEWSWATPESPGLAPVRTAVVQRDVRRLREEVDVVVVMPHWGEEYTATPEPWQVDYARAAVEAGADVVVGGHAHWPKGIEVYEGSPVFYGVGNFVFDQTWSEETSTGVFAEITLYGDRVVQARPVPFLILPYGQPNFLTPEGGGRRALENIYAASLGPEFESQAADR